MSFITLIRHTSVNIPKAMIYGQTDVPLNDSFDYEAKEVIKKLDRKSFDAIYSSPLSRCVKLANKIAKDTTVKTDQRLMELNFGDWEQKYWKDIDQSKKAQRWFNDYLNESCPNGESYQEMQERIRSFLNMIEKQKDQNIAIVTHGGPIRAFLSLLEGIPQNEIFKRDISYGQVINCRIQNTNTSIRS